MVGDRPPSADFAIVIEFVREEGSPQRVFRAADSLITAFQELDRSLVKSIDANIEPIMILEDIQAGSLKIWLRSGLQATEDQALKEINWKPQVGKYLVRAKYVVLDFINKRIDNYFKKNSFG